MNKSYNMYILIAVISVISIIITIGVVTVQNSEGQNILDETSELEKIISDSQKGYDTFSEENYPLTGGFSPDWLEGEREKILQTCQEASKVGVELPYCKYV